jgi:hypothetical protein
VVASSAKAQMQPLAHCVEDVQLPRQAAKPLASVRNWRAETVPAQRTAVTIIARNVDLIIFLGMIAPFKLQGRVTALGIHGGLAAAHTLL